MGKPSRGRELLILAVAMTLPALLTWGWLTAQALNVASGPAPLSLYFLSRVVQFSLPLVWFRMAEGRWPAWFRLRLDGLAWGVGFGFLMAGTILIVYFAGARDWPLLREAPARLSASAAAQGVAHPLLMLVVLLFVVLAHSGLEEYYWRWFVFGRLREQTSEAAAILLSSVAFMAHHVLDLNDLLPGHLWTAALPLSLTIAVGGAFWAWLYGRYRSLMALWFSHALIDASLAVVAWNLMHRAA